MSLRIRNADGKTTTLARNDAFVEICDAEDNLLMVAFEKSDGTVKILQYSRNPEEFKRYCRLFKIDKVVDKEIFLKLKD